MDRNGKGQESGQFSKVSCLHSLNLNLINAYIYPVRTLNACRVIMKAHMFPGHMLCRKL